MDDLISRQALQNAMYHEAFETDSDMQKWDNGCWIRYKLFENVVEALPSVEPENLQPICNQLATDCISRQAAIDALTRQAEWLQGLQLGDRYKDQHKGLLTARNLIEDLPSAQPELIERTAYIRGFEQGRTQGMIDSQAEHTKKGEKNMKAEWTNADALNLQPTCNQLATDCISRRAAVDALIEWYGCKPNDIEAFEEIIEALPSAQPTQNNRINSNNALDTISRQAAIDAVSRGCQELRGVFARCEKNLNELPSAQPERDIPMKPNETIDSSWGIRKKQAVCPKCDYYLGRVEFIGNPNGKKVTYCETCGQAINWEGWEWDE